MTVDIGLKRIRRSEATLTEFGAHLEPQLRVGLREQFLVETNDNFFNRISKEGDKPDDSLDFMTAQQFIAVNPVGGPIYVDGVEPGDTLVVSIDKMVVRDWGWTGIMPGFGPLAGLAEFAELQEPFGTIIRNVPGPSGTLEDGTAVMNVGREVSWELNPHIGTIVTAPERGVENTLVSQGPWGGNLDVRDVCAGNKIHLNASHAGGLLFVGDVHASQGDSELTGLANETAADITLSCDVIKNRRVPGVCRIETPNSLIQLDSSRNAGTSERALANCFVNMIRWLNEDYEMDKREAYLHMTANSRVRINVYQATTGFFTCGVEFPKANL